MAPGIGRRPLRLRAARMTATLGPLQRLLRFRAQQSPKAEKNRVHLEVAVGPQDRAVERLLALGARLLADRASGSRSGVRRVHRQRPA